MLFDLKGKRRRVVQGVYLTLAVLMGGGLVLFGIGGDVSGGLFDAFSDRGGGGGDKGNEQIEKRIEAAEKKLKANPKDQAALKVVVRSNYNLAQADFDEQKNTYGKDGQKDLEESAAAWKRYVALKPEQLDASLASTAAQVFIALNQPADAARAIEIAAAQREEPEPYLQLVQLWTLAGDKRKADLAGKKVISLAPKEQREAAEQAVEQAKQPASAQQQGQQGADPGGVKAE